MLPFTLSEAVAVFDLPTTIVFGITLLTFIIPVLILFPPAPVRISEALAQTHTKIGVSPSESNLPQPADAVREDGKPRVKSLMVYPVKSCRGVELTKTKVVPSGLQHDRLYTFARLRSRPSAVGVEGGEEEPVWEMVSQRHCSRMALLSVDIWCPSPAKTRGKLTEQGSDEAFLVLRYPWSRPGLGGVVDWIGAKLGKGWRGVPEREVLLPVTRPTDEEIAERGYGLELVKIWMDTVRAVNMGKELPEELAGFLGLKDKLGLFRMGNDTWREVYRCAPTEEEAGYQPVIEFHDAYPIHIMNVASVREVNKQIGDETLDGLNILRFRPNVIIDGPPAYEEETWKSFGLNQGDASIATDCTYHVSCRTARCKLPNVNPETAVVHRVEPDRYLRKHRNVDEGCPLLGCLGMMLTPIFPKAPAADGLGTRESWLEVGMEIDVRERGKHVYIKQ